MKKVIVALLLFIPIIIILTISVSQMIISAEVAIDIESFVLKHQGEEVSQVTVDYGYYHNRNLKYQLIPVYLPEIAQVDGFTWSSDNPAIASVDSNGVVAFNDCGFAKITAVCKNNKSVRASCSFIIEDEAIHSVKLYSYNNGDSLSGEIYMRKYQTMQLRSEINPYVALQGDIAYSSSVPAIAKVDSNGILTAVSDGDTTITVMAKDKTGATKTISLKVKVYGTALATATKVYAFGNSKDLTDIITSGELSSGGKVVDLSGIAVGGSTTAVVTNGIDSETVTIVKLANENSIGIKEMAALEDGEWKSGKYLAVGGNKSITPINLITGELVEAQIVSSNSAVVKVVGNKLVGVSEGEATITLSANGFDSYSFDVNCATPVSYFTLNFDVDDDRVGLGVDRVFGTHSYYDGEKVNGIKVEVDSIYPANSNKELFTFETDSPYATIDKNGLLTFTNEAIGKEVKVTVKSLFSTSSITRTYNFKHIVNGSNVGLGYGANPYNEKKNVMPAFDPYYDMLKVVNDDQSEALVFHTNIYLPSMPVVDALTSTYTHTKLALTRDIYGNGYKIDGQIYLANADKTEGGDGYETHILDAIGDDDVVGISHVKVQSLNIQSFAPTSSDSADAFTDLMTKGGTPLRIDIKNLDTQFQLDFEFCIFQYAYSHVVVMGGDVKFDGCIFRNSVGPALNVQSLHGKESNVVVNNCLFSNTLSSVAMVSNGSFPSEADSVRYNTLTWTGVNYIYNWKKADEIRMDIIPENILKNPALNALLREVNGKLTESARNSFVKTTNDGLTRTVGKDKYVNLGVLCLSAWSDLKLIENGSRENVTDGFLLNIDPKYSSCLEFKLSTVNIRALSSTLKKLGLNLSRTTYMITNKNENGEFSTAPKEKYNLDEKTYMKLRGE